MKKYPYVFLGIFIAIFIFIVIHIISVPIKMNRMMKVKQLDSIYNTLDEYNKKIDKVKKDECKNSLINMSDRIRDTYYTNDISVKDYYNNYFADDYKFDVYYKNVIEKCGIEDKTSIYNKVLESMVFPYEIQNEYLGSYQINLNDLFVMNDEVNRVDELGTYSNKHLEVEVLNDLISEVSKK